MTGSRALTAVRPLLVVAALVLVPLAACGDDDAEPGATTTTTVDDSTTTTSAEDSTTSTSTTAPAGTAPDSVAAVLGDGSLALLDPDSGEVRSTLLEDIDVSDPAKNGITTTPGGDEIFVVRPEPGDGFAHEIVRVPADGGDPEVIAEGRAPAVSPNGSTLAYVEVELGDSPGQPTPSIVLHDLGTGDERRLTREQEPDYYFIVDVAWTADSEQVAFVAGEIQTGLHVVDADATSLDTAQRLGPTARGEGTSWTAVTAYDEERLAVMETCCGVPSEERWNMVAVHVETGTVEGTVLPEERVEASRIDSDGSTRHLLLVTDLRPGGGTLHRWSSPPTDPGEGDDTVTHELRHLRDGVVVAAW